MTLTDSLIADGTSAGKHVGVALDAEIIGRTHDEAAACIDKSKIRFSYTRVCQSRPALFFPLANVCRIPVRSTCCLSQCLSSTILGETQSCSFFFFVFFLQNWFIVKILLLETTYILNGDSVNSSYSSYSNMWREERILASCKKNIFSFSAILRETHNLVLNQSWPTEFSNSSSAWKTQ